MKFLACFVALFALAAAAPVEDPVVPGGLHQINVTDPQLAVILEQAQKDLNAQMNSVFYYKVGTVIEAYTQVVAGVMYHIKFEFGATKCMKNQILTQLSECIGFEQVQVCTVKVFSQVWTGLLETSSFHCEAKSTAPPQTHPMTAAPGSFYADGEMPGGPHKLEVTDPSLLDVLAEAELKINHDFLGKFYQRITKVVEAESQVVNGVAYHVTFELSETQCAKDKVTKETNLKTECNMLSNVEICKATIISQPWMNSTEVTHIACQSKPTEPVEVKTGGNTPVAVDDAGLLMVLAEAEPKINKNFMGTQYQRIGKVVKAEKQVVAGILYHVTFEFETTNCLKEKVTKDTNIKAECGTVSAKSVCQATILSQEWLHSVEVSKIECVSTDMTATGEFYEDTPTGIMAGGHQKMDVNDAELLKTLVEITPQVNDKLASTFFYRIGKVLSAESQVVSGVMYYVSFELGQTQCFKSKVTKDTNVLTECSEFSNVQVCTAKIWSQPWLHHLEVTEVNCEAQKIDVPNSSLKNP